MKPARLEKLKKALVLEACFVHSGDEKKQETMRSVNKTACGQTLRILLTSKKYKRILM